MPILGIWASQGRVPATSYESIATVTVGSGGSSQIDFTSIPSTFTHLQLRGNYSCSTGPGTLRLRVGNGSIDTGLNYAGHQIAGNGSVLQFFTAGPSGDSDFMLLDSQQTYQWTFTSDYVDYANTNKYKTIKHLIGGDNNGSGFVGLRSSLWMSSSAITNIRIYTQSGNFAQYSSFALYGIKGA